MPGPIAVPWPTSSFPGGSAQESAGRLINVTAEPLGDSSADKVAWHRQPGLSVFAGSINSGYRGGMLVGGTSYDVWAGEAATVGAGGGVVTNIGALAGTKKISIAHNQLQPTPNVVVVDPDNGAFDLTSGVPVPYNAAGILPQPNSVTFQDSYLFFSIADGRIFATDNNSLNINALSFTTCQAKSDVVLLRVIAYAGQLLAFTTASCEVYQDTANPAPGFPYSRLVVLEYGLIQSAAIAGFETGFSDLCWVAHDFGVYHMPPSSLQPVKISPPDLDRLIEVQVRAGNLLDAHCYVFGGKKFWAINSPNWSWEINLNTSKWNERMSLGADGIQHRWRATSSHLAFGKWLVGDVSTGALLVVDDQNVTEIGAPMLCRIESGPVNNFPIRQRVPRADFDFVTGVGQAQRAITTAVTGTQAAANGEVILFVMDASQYNTNDYVQVANVGGTTEANGVWLTTVINDLEIQLQGSRFANAWTSGGTATDITAPNNMMNPTVAISWSDDDGQTWKNPILRALGQQGRSLRMRISVKNTGITGPRSRRWRVDVTDPVYFAFFGSIQQTDSREY